jgi:hypothetical protein
MDDPDLSDVPTEQEELAWQMEEGYRSEAMELSLDPEWSGLEVEGLCSG